MVDDRISLWEKAFGTDLMQMRSECGMNDLRVWIKLYYLADFAKGWWRGRGPWINQLFRMEKISWNVKWHDDHNDSMGRWFFSLRVIVELLMIWSAKLPSDQSVYSLPSYRWTWIMINTSHLTPWIKEFRSCYKHTANHANHSTHGTFLFYKLTTGELGAL